ncbi:hypothetical protein [Embleya hyalina]|uniref:hypothetical protein n=1 Tax=Embleya hyalina TaxID=516124 RepID=UPI000F82A342|nr:hypothetical protein [Embleya hyalina]
MAAPHGPRAVAAAELPEAAAPVPVPGRAAAALAATFGGGLALDRHLDARESHASREVAAGCGQRVYGVRLHTVKALVDSVALGAPVRAGEPSGDR